MVSTAPTLRQATILAKERVQKVTIRKRISNVRELIYYASEIPQNNGPLPLTYLYRLWHLRCFMISSTTVFSVSLWM